MNVPAGHTPRSVQFRKEREAQWHELASLVELALRRGLRSLNDQQVERLPRLYRTVLSSLMVARETAMDRALVSYLEALSARAYLVVYGSRRPSRAVFANFLLRTFPRSVRAMAGEVALSSLLFFLGIAVAAALVSVDSSWYFAFVPEDLAGGRSPDASTETLRSALYDGDASSALTTFSSFLFTHNARIGMMAFALGIAAGIPTALLIFYNGTMLGAFLALYAERGLLWNLLGWLLPHGVPEISAVILCGAAGLAVGRALLFPGQQSIRSALKLRGRRAALVVAGTILLFAVAGVIEGVFRQVVTDDFARYIMAAFNAAWLLLWVVFTGRSDEAEPDDHSSAAEAAPEVAR